MGQALKVANFEFEKKFFWMCTMRADKVFRMIEEEVQRLLGLLNWCAPNF